MTYYNAYVTVKDEEGRRMGRVGLAPLAESINAHVKQRAEDEERFDIYPCWRVASHLGKPVLRMEARTASEVRANWGEAQRFIRLTGYRATFSPTTATAKALNGRSL